MALADFTTAAKLRDLVEDLCGKYLERVRPAYRYATVQTVDFALRQATVKFPEDGPGESMVVRFALNVPYVGAIVRIDGRSGDRFIAEITGSAAGAVVLGGVIDYTGPSTSVPFGYVLPYGQAISRTIYAAYFLLVGTTYGVGDGSTTFNVPDYRGRVGAGLDNMGGSDAGRLSTANTLGTAMGAETVTQAASDVAAHAHGVSITTGTESTAHTHTRSMLTGYGGSAANPGNTLNGGSFPPPVFAANSGTGYTFWETGNSSAQSTNHTHGVSGNTGNNSQTTSMNKMQPTITVNKILRVL